MLRSVIVGVIGGLLLPLHYFVGTVHIAFSKYLADVLGILHLVAGLSCVLLLFFFEVLLLFTDVVQLNIIILVVLLMEANAPHIVLELG